jgi:hypothetical protein
MSWLGEGTNATQLKHWLDPANSGATTIDGIDPAGTPDSLDAAVLGINGASGNICSSFINPSVSIQNLGATTLTQATITYTYNGGASQQYNWNGNLASYQIDNINLPLSSHPSGSNILSIAISAPNGGVDQNTSNDTISSIFYIVDNATAATLTIHPDCYASETSWKIRRQSDAAVIAQGGTYSDNATPTDINENRCIPVGCYNFVVYDAYGDGMSNTSFSCNQKKGSLELKDMYGTVLCQMTQAQSAFGDSLLIPFCVTGASLNVPKYSLEDVVAIYPNPTSDKVSISASVEGPKQISIWSTNGQLLVTKSSETFVTDVSLIDFEKGIYFVHIQTLLGTTIKKLVKN